MQGGQISCKWPSTYSKCSLGEVCEWGQVASAGGLFKCVGSPQGDSTCRSVGYHSIGKAD